MSIRLHDQPGANVEGLGAACPVLAEVGGTAHLDAAGVTLPDGRVAVLIVVDDLGDGVSASTGNVSGSTAAGRVRSAYNSAKGL